VEAGRRPADADRVKMIAESMREIGLQTPISVWSPDNGGTIRLVAGRHRLEAAKLLGWDHIECSWLILGETERRMWEIAENLHRAELSALERGEQIAEWVRLVETRQVQSAQIGPIESKREDGRGHRHENGVKAAARDLGIERHEAQRAVKRTENIAPDVRQQIHEKLPGVANSGVELDALARMSVDRQREAVNLVQDGVPKTVRQALGRMMTAQEKPAPTPVAAALARDRHVEAVIAAVQKLSETELAVFTDWFEAWRADAEGSTMRPDRTHKRSGAGNTLDSSVLGLSEVFV
jgi:ParB family chromosome partitioning protein